MKKDKPSQKKVNLESNVFLYLEGELAYAIDTIKTDYLMEIDISHKDKFIKQIAKSTPAELVRIAKVTGGLIEHLFSSGVIKVKVPVNHLRHLNIDFPHLLRDALSGTSRYFDPEMKKGFP